MNAIRPTVWESETPTLTDQDSPAVRLRGLGSKSYYLIVINLTKSEDQKEHSYDSIPPCYNSFDSVESQKLYFCQLASFWKYIGSPSYGHPSFGLLFFHFCTTSVLPSVVLSHMPDSGGWSRTTRCFVYVQGPRTNLNLEGLCARYIWDKSNLWYAATEGKRNGKTDSLPYCHCAKALWLTVIC